MHYLLSISIPLIFPIILISILIYFGIYLLYLRKKTKQPFWFHFIRCVFIAYVLFVLSIAWLPLTGFSIQDTPINSNFIPFFTLRVAFSQGSSSILFIGVLLNYMMFLPLGFLLPIISKKVNSIWKALLIALGVSLIIEIIQGLFPIIGRSFDIDDIICNTLGGLIGYCVYVIGTWTLIRIGKKNIVENKKITTIGAVSLFILSIAIPCISIIKYNISEFGRMPIEYSLNAVVLPKTIELTFEDIPRRKINTFKRFDTIDEMELMEELKAKLGVTGKAHYQDERKNLYVCTDEENIERSIVIFSDDKSWRFTAPQFVEEEKNDLTDDECILLASKYLKDIGLWDKGFIPKEVTDHNHLSDGNEGSELLAATKIVVFEYGENESYISSGQLLVEVASEEQEYTITNELIKYEAYKEVNILSAKEAFARFQRNGYGEIIYSVGSMDKAILTDVRLDYRYEPNKKILMPIYAIEGLAVNDGTKNQIIINIPAMK